MGKYIISDFLGMFALRLESVKESFWRSMMRQNNLILKVHGDGAARSSKVNLASVRFA